MQVCSAAYWWLHCERGKGPLLIEADIACGSKIDHGRGAETYGAAMLSSFLLRMGSDMLTECCRWESIGRVWVSVGAEELCSAVQSAGKQLGLPPLNYPPRLKRVNLWRAGRQIEDSTVNYPKRQRCGDAVWQHAASHVQGALCSQDPRNAAAVHTHACAAAAPAFEAESHLAPSPVQWYSIHPKPTWSGLLCALAAAHRHTCSHHFTWTRTQLSTRRIADLDRLWHILAESTGYNSIERHCPTSPTSPSI